jgi:hypothetical protein
MISLPPTILVRTPERADEFARTRGRSFSESPRTVTRVASTRMTGSAVRAK